MTFSCVSATAESDSRHPQDVRRSDTPRWVYLFFAGTCLWSADVCDAQIQVNAYIPSASVNVSNGQPTFNPGQVFIVDTATNQVVGSPISVGLLPAGVTVTPDGRYAYITNNGSGTISVIDTASQTAVGSIKVAPGPIGIAASPNASLVFATSPGTIFANSFDGQTVSVIDKGTNALVGSLTSGTGPIGVAFTPDGTQAYIANSGSNSVSVINTASNVVALSIPVGNSPTGVAITPNGQYAYVANQNQNNAGLPGTVSVIATAAKDVVHTIDVGNSPTGVAITPNGQYVYVTNMNNNNGDSNRISAGTVSVISTATNTVVGTITVGQSPIGVSVTPDGKYVYVSNSNIGNIGNSGPLVGIVSVISTVTNTVVASTPLGTVNLSFGSFISPNILVARGGPLLIGNDAGLTALGFQQFVNFNGGAIKLTGDWVTSRMVSLLSQGGTIDTNSFNATLSAKIINSGSLTKIGAGTLTLSGDNTFSGGTVLDAGTLVVASPQALGLGDVVVNGGVLRADPQPINVKGDYTQNTGGTLQLGIGGSAAGQYDFLNVNGHATLGGTLDLISLGGFQPKVGDKLTLAIAGSGISGQFAEVVGSFAVFSLDLLYGQNTVVLEFSGTDFAAFAQTPNQLTVAKQLDHVAADPRESELISFLENEPLANLPADFEKISPDSLTALYEISFSAANVQAANLENRLAEIRSGSSGFSSSLSVSNAPGTMTEGKDGKAVIEGKSVLAPSPENKWGVWISGTGNFVNVSGDGNAKGYDFVTGGVTLGVDYRLSKYFAIGIAAGYAYTGTNLTGNGSINVNSGKAGVYATYFKGGFYLNGYVGGGYNSYDTRRTALVGNATGNTDGGEFNAFVGTGYELRYGAWTFGPIGSLQYTYVDFSGFAENGSLAPLRIESQSQDSLRTNLGLSASYTWKAGKVEITPNVRASWQHEYLYSALPIDAQFASGGGSIFTVNGPALGHDSALIDAGLNVQWTPTIGTYFGYNGQVGRGNYDLNGVLCSVHISF
jgi:outer membrane autotransporter protein